MQNIPLVALAEPAGDVVAAYTGPNVGITSLDYRCSQPLAVCDEAIAGVNDWNNPAEFAFGTSLSFYEEDRSVAGAANVDRVPVIVGEPVADVFAVQARENMAVMALADGVNWGPKPRLAARCAVRAVMEHITANLSQVTLEPNSHALASLLLESVTQKAQALILEHNGTLTTLSAAVVCKMAASAEWGLFVVAVGDSPVYVYCPHNQSVLEMTVGCHSQDGKRDARMAGGTLGPSCGSNPDLENLSVAFMTIYEGDIVFITSDGISDNFTTKSVQKMTGRVPTEEEASKCHHKMKPCCDTIIHLTEVLSRHHQELGGNMTAQTVVAKLVNYVSEFTQQKRLFHSYCIENNINIRTHSMEDPNFAEQVAMLPGKLDHAAVVAYQVGKHPHRGVL